jgi:hypothetical protein
MLHACSPQAKAAAGPSGLLLYTPRNASLLVGSDFTSFFIAANSDLAIPGMRLAPGEYQVIAGANPDAHLWLQCADRTLRSAPFVVDISGSTLVFQARAF